MRLMLAGLVFLIGMGQAHALRCTLKRENPKTAGTYDQTVFNSIKVLKDGATTQTILVKPDSSVVEKFDYQSLKMIQMEKLKEIDGSLIVTIATDDDDLAIGTGLVDISNKKKMTQMTGVAAGERDGRYLSFVDFFNKVMLTCVNE